MNIGGLQKLSLIDFPGKISAVIFTQGCNFRCPYCHNAQLVDPSRYEDLIDEQEIFDFLKKRIGKIEGVVITGGEPVLQRDLADFIRRVKELGFLVKLDSNGSCPEVLQNLIDVKLVDFIAMDIKAPLEKYSPVSGVKVDIDAIKKSIDIIQSSNIPHEFRTTVVKSMLSEADLQQIKGMINEPENYKFKDFIPGDNLLDKGLK